jgi:4-amino-4-deoxy-L-arabinose transferase-like glycosyltransferase
VINRSSIFRFIVFGSLVLISISIFLYHLSSFPPPAIWDEGWTLSVAKNLAQDGFYGHYKSGEPQPPELSASYTVVIPVALSFKGFGVGILQARLPIALFALGTLCLLFFLGCGLANSWVGWGAVFVALFVAPHPDANPIYYGRQVLAEMPMLFFLLLGYKFILQVKRSWMWALVAALSWGIALQTKAQLLPFLVIALAFPLFIALYRRQWKLAALFALGMGGSWLAAQGANRLWGAIIQDHVLWRQAIPRLVNILAINLDPVSRRTALLAVLVVGLPGVIALSYALWKYGRILIREKTLTPQTLIWISLLVFCASWYGWYLTLSIGWGRYMMPAIFVSSLFVSKMLYDLTEGGKIKVLFTCLGQSVMHMNFLRRKGLILWLCLLLIMIGALTITRAYMPILLSSPDTASAQAIEYLRTQLPPEALIESYESELLFFLDRPIHYPPAVISAVAVERRSDAELILDYDPLEADPDYLVIGNFARVYRVYEQVLFSDQFTLLLRSGDYEIYQRLR